MPKLWQALISLLILVGSLVLGIMVLPEPDGDTFIHIPMIIGTVAAAIVAILLGYSWQRLEKAMVDGISRAMQSLLILIVIGILIGVWINAGVVPSMIYYGLQIIKPNIFLLATVLICSITSVATGTSWGTMGTMGIALLGIGTGLGIDPGITTGAIISGAYFGDKMSPLSDMTNLGPAMAGTDVMTNIKFMLKPTAVVYGITLIFFAVLPTVLKTNTEGGSMEAIKQISDGIAGEFTVSPVLLLPLVIVIVAVAMKVPALPGILLGIVSGAALGFLYQGDHYTMQSIFACGMDGYVSNTGIEAVDKLLSKGGLNSMMYSVSMTILAMAYCGIMEESHQMEVIVQTLKPLARNKTSLVALTEATSIASNAIMPEQYLSVVLPGRMYAEEYKKMGMHPVALSNALLSSGAVTSALIPWNTCGVYIFATLGVGVSQYFPYAIFNWLMPIAAVAMAAIGMTTCDENGVPLIKARRMAKAK
ncbi:MAG: Na+/H+ antiporter NhaC [Oscillospiraceae bacterium]|nr:Na+/H+ antiporter NhaC [Oscillospiraceae bacterium]